MQLAIKPLSMVSFPETFLEQGAAIPCPALYFTDVELSAKDYELHVLPALRETLANTVWHRQYTFKEVSAWIDEPSKPTKNDRHFRSKPSGQKRAKTSSFRTAKGISLSFMVKLIYC